MLPNERCICTSPTTSSRGARRAGSPASRTPIAGAAETQSASKPATAAPSSHKAVERGRYLVQIAGCNDCHTPGYMQTEGKVPEAQWLTGDHFGWRGPWGTTYAVNLRQYMQSLN